MNRRYIHGVQFGAAYRCSGRAVSRTRIRATSRSRSTGRSCVPRRARAEQSSVARHQLLVGSAGRRARRLRTPSGSQLLLDGWQLSGENDVRQRRLGADVILTTIGQLRLHRRRRWERAADLRAAILRAVVRPSSSAIPPMASRQSADRLVRHVSVPGPRDRATTATRRATP